MTTYTEFNSDLFLCNSLIKPKPDDCRTYPINTKCDTGNETCEICKNFAYKEWYDKNNPKSISFIANHDDSKHEYSRTWIQTCNLGIGIILLSIGIYYQSE